MGHRVVSDFMPFCDHSLDQLRVSCRARPDDEESRQHLVLRENVKDRSRPAWIRTVVKGQINITISGCANVIASRFRQAAETGHSSGPFRSIMVPAGHSLIGRPIGKTRTTKSWSVRVGGKSR